MKNTYNYMKQIQYLDSIEIDNIGNCIIEAFTDDGDVYYLIIRTVLGVSRIFQMGPIQNGATIECYCQFKQLDYDDYKIDKIINKFISGNQLITQINVFDIESKNDILEVTNKLPDMRSLLYD